MKDKISVSIVAYNNYDDIINAVESLEKHTVASIKKKIYIVDNSCKKKDDSDRLEFELSVTRHPDVRYIDTGANLGFGKGHNYILNKIDSEYHAIVNPDIIFIEDSFSSIIDYLENNYDVGMCIPRIVDEQNEMQKVYRENPTILDMFIRMFMKGIFKERENKHTLQEEDYSKPFKVPFGQGSFLVVRTQLLKELNGFDDAFFMYMEDADLCRRVNQQSKLMYFPGTTVIHKWEKGSHKNIKLLKIHIRSMFYYFIKWGIKWF